ncbi:glycerol-3-phosphate acyltransferase 1, mitochondrial isoform X2 [Acyrthosiphon pisum]|uniref:Phospholipid/glycerol acyltransferase domain-containing protein n=1 Tax=Acyrthosiphon pisum TaxID=7029 RepID=A0A8R1W7J7_ACYPI|nr:glycerol-3-phosphate acyltransferase 1, mitochondrial isoform X2 [Acyrthosiphon pisum]|eukprot:XP_003247305.1 PREDICTED: glycerol-3-phosphate acyltransferase 1, mitochondrial isoform X2 [Acyrthosiphon pisum]
MDLPKSDEMVEALATGFQNLYNKYTRSENGPQDGGRRDVYIVPVNNNTAVATGDAQSQFLLQRYRPKARRSFVFDAKHLCQAKTLKWHMMRQSRLRASMGQCCPVCIPNTPCGTAKVVSNLKNLLDIYNIGNIQKSMFGCFVDDLKFFYQLKSQEYKYIYDEVLEDEVVEKAIAAAARNACSEDAVVGDSRFDEEMKTQQANTRRILTVISANVKNWVYKVIGWFTYRMISLLATSLVVQPTQIDRVREAEQSGLPVIYLPLHKSHMDYILLGLVLTVNNIKPPLVAAGENLRVFFISKLLSFLGAFYIKRHIDTKRDQLYWSVLSSYIKNSMKNGHHIEFFLEGARTRSGKCCVPKAGLLSIIVDAYREKVIEDAWIIPVSMSYDRILEGNFVREQLGQPKKKETFFAAISTFIKAICSHYGIMRVDFNKPYRLRDLYESIDKLTKLENESLNKNGMEMMSATICYKTTVDRMAKHIVYDCWKSTPIMSTHAVCFLLLNKHRNGTTLEQLAKDLSLMRDKLSQADRDVGFSGRSIEVIKHALDLLGPKLVVYENTDSGRIVKPILDVPVLIELSYYGNNLISHFMHQSLVALTICKLIRWDFLDKAITEMIISRNDLVGDVTFLTNLLQFDFVFIKPCDTLDNIVDTVIRHFEEEEIILMDMILEEERRSQHIAKMLDSDSDDDYQRPYVEIDVKYRVNTNVNSLNKLKFYRSVMMPYLECMAESAGSFLALSNNSVIEREHVQTILNQMHENLKEGILSYGESISLDTIKHSFLAFEKFDCLKITTKDNIKTLQMNNQPNELNPCMQAMSDYIEEFVKQLN